MLNWNKLLQISTFCLLLSVFSCVQSNKRNIQQDLSGAWVIDSLYSRQPLSDQEKQQLQSLQEEQLASSYFRFNPDQSFSLCLEDSILKGKWSLQELLLYIQFENGQSSSFTMLELQEDLLLLEIPILVNQRELLLVQQMRPAKLGVDCKPKSNIKDGLCSAPRYQSINPFKNWEFPYFTYKEALNCAIKRKKPLLLLYSTADHSEDQQCLQLLNHEPRLQQFIQEEFSFLLVFKELEIPELSRDSSLQFLDKLLIQEQKTPLFLVINPDDESLMQRLDPPFNDLVLKRFLMETAKRVE